MKIETEISSVASYCRWRIKEEQHSFNERYYPFGREKPLVAPTAITVVNLKATTQTESTERR